MGSKKVSAVRKDPSPLRKILKWAIRILLFVAFLALLIWQWPNITRFFSNLVSGIYGLLGWGLILILLAIIVVLFIAFRGRLVAFARHYKLYLWHVIIGAIALFVAIWGILGLFSLGGDVGAAIVSHDPVVGLLRVIGLILLGIIFIAPRACFRAIRGLGRFLIGLFRQPPRPYPADASTSPYMPKRVTPTPPATTTPVSPPRREGGIITGAAPTSKSHEGGIITGAAPAEKKTWFPPFRKSPPAGESPMTASDAPAYKEVFPVKTQGPIIPTRSDTPTGEGSKSSFSEGAAASDTPAYKEVFPIKSPNPQIPARPDASAGDSPKPPLSEGATASDTPAYKEVFPVKNQSPIIPTHSDVPAEVTPKFPVREIPTQGPESRQVALDIWRQYGEPASLTSVDGWKMPHVDILDKTRETEFNDADNAQRAQVIEEALASYGVAGKVVQINVGPTVTQFGIEPGWDIKTKRVVEKDKDGNTIVREEEVARIRVKVERITSLANDLALALAAPTIRIEAPVPGKPIVGVEVPNRVYSTVSLRSVIETNAFQKILTKSKLAMALGKGAGGEAVSADLAKMPHLLIAGATGSGKTVCLNAVICCILMNNSPYDTKLVLIDPKRVELTPFNSLPHLAAPVIVDTDKALAAMRWLNVEMDNRYKKLANAGARNIEGFNHDKTGAEKMPNLVLVIDELADLMMAGFDEVEHILCRLAQLARAVGIHLVVATQRPSVDVITGLIKANFPTRISFAVTSQVDSRTVLDMVGAEKLLGHGDMLFAPTDAAKPKRLQGCYVSDPEVERLVYFWNSQKRDDNMLIKLEDMMAMSAAQKDTGEDPLMETVRKLAQDHNQQISASFLQRKLNIGYPRAARLFDRYKEEMGPNGDGGAEAPGDDDDDDLE